MYNLGGWQQKKTSTKCDTKSKPLPKDCILNSILNLQKLSQEIDDITAEALSDKMMSEVKSQEELHNLTIWYPLLTGSRKGMNSVITGKSFSEALILGSVNPQYDKRLFIEFPEKY